MSWYWMIFPAMLCAFGALIEATNWYVIINRVRWSPIYVIGPFLIMIGVMVGVSWTRDTIWHPVTIAVMVAAVGSHAMMFWMAGRAYRRGWMSND